jgi:hypothetical protein
VLVLFQTGINVFNRILRRHRNDRTTKSKPQRANLAVACLEAIKVTQKEKEPLSNFLMHHDLTTKISGRN